MVAMMTTLVLLCAQACATYYVDFDSRLTAAIGETSAEVKYPSLENMLSKRYEAGRLVREYALSVIGRCRWEFTFDVDTGKILSWRYPDVAAEKGCRQVVRSMT
jgi:hypothetical protein